MKFKLALYRAVKTCLWFRKHNFWSQCGSSKYAGNFAKTPFQIGQIVDIFICYPKEWTVRVPDFVSVTYICIRVKNKACLKPPNRSEVTIQ